MHVRIRGFESLPIRMFEQLGNETATLGFVGCQFGLVFTVIGYKMSCTYFKSKARVETRYLAEVGPRTDEIVHLRCALEEEGLGSSFVEVELHHVERRMRGLRETEFDYDTYRETFHLATEVYDRAFLTAKLLGRMGRENKNVC